MRNAVYPLSLKHNLIWLIPFFILGVIFRLWLIQLVPQPFVYDQLEYHRYALGILSHNLYAETARMYGYPLILAFTYRFFGSENSFVWKLLQVLLDNATALLIFLIALKIFKKRMPAFFVFLLYLFNPWSSAYTGVLLTEVVSIFLVSLSYLLFLDFLQTRRLSILTLLALSLGFLPQVRPAFLFFSFFFLLLFLSLSVKLFARKKIKSGAIVCLLLFYFLPFSYTLAGNLLYFRQFSLTTVDNLTVREFNLSLYLNTSASPSPFPPNVIGLYEEYSNHSKDQKERDEITQKYLQLAIQEIKRDPLKFIKQRFYKVHFIWEKKMLFPYADQKEGTSTFLLSWLNNIILSLSFVGFASFVKNISFKDKDRLWFAVLSGSLFFYVIFSAIFSAAEQRYSLPAYSLVFLFAGFAVWQICSFSIRRIKEVGT